jgi:hypothetical protein
MREQRRTVPTKPLLLLLGRLFEPRTVQMKPLARALLVIARNHLPIAAPITITILLFIGIVRVAEFGVVFVFLVEGLLIVADG